MKIIRESLDCSQGRFTLLLVLLGVTLVAAYYLAAAVVNGPGPLAIPQYDTLLYCQCARRIVEGHAFSFSAGEAMSTGTTSVLYPFILAVPYALGLKGPALMGVGFVLNALFALIFLLGWNFAFSRWLPKRIARFASLLLLLSVQPIYCALAQSDMGCWMALTALLAVALSVERWGAAGFLVFLAPWVRPEGLVLSVSLMMIGILVRRRAYPVLALCGFASATGVMALNWALTGAVGFSSVANKGYFTTLPLANAILNSVSDLVGMLREIVFAQATVLPRILYAIPVVGAVVFLLGAFVRRWDLRRDAALVFFALSSFGALLVVAQSGWQGMNMDRYLSWVMPIVVFFSATGWHWIYERLRGFPSAPVVLAVPVLFGLGATLTALSYFNSCSEISERTYKFAQELERILPKGASVGGWEAVAEAYALSDRRLAHLSAIYSPEFAFREPMTVYETLKHEPKTRFDYWIVHPDMVGNRELQSVLGPVLMAGPRSELVHAPRWEAFDVAARVPRLEGRRLVDRVDVGYEKDELRAGYEIVHSYAMRPFYPVLCVDMLAGTNAVEVGRAVIGRDAMTVSNVDPGKDLFILLRTRQEITAVQRFDMHLSFHYVFSHELDLHVNVDGADAACCHAHVAEKGFSDVVLRVPGKFVSTSNPRIVIEGDHAAFGYWFYQ